MRSVESGNTNGISGAITSEGCKTGYDCCCTVLTTVFTALVSLVLVALLFTAVVEMAEIAVQCRWPYWHRL